MPRVGSIIKNTRGCAEPALIDGNALGKPRTDPSELQPVQDAKARMRVKATGQEVLEHAALMEYALGSAILGQEQDIALHATRRRDELQGLAVDADTAARTGDEARERAGHHIGARADLPGDADNLAARRDQRQVLYDAVDIECFHHERLAGIR